MLLLLRLPCRQPLIELFLADNFYDPVHLVVSEPAKLRTGNLIIPCLNRCEMHTDRQTGHGVLFETECRNKETMNDVVSAQDHFDLPVHRHHHCSCYDVVFGGRVFRIETQSSFAPGRRVFELRLRCAKLAVGSGIAEVPGELHTGHFHAHGIGFSRAKTLGGPDGTAHQIQAHKKYRREHGPDNLQRSVAVRVFRLIRGSAAVAVSPDKESQAHLRGHKDNAHEDVRGGEMMISRTRPMAHDLHTWILGPPHRGLLEITEIENWESKPGRIYHSFFRAQAGSCISFFPCTQLHVWTRRKSFPRKSKSRIDEFF